MFLCEPIIESFIAGISHEDSLNINVIVDDEEAFEFISKLYERDFGTIPSGVGEYLIRTKFQIGSEEHNRRFVPDSLKFNFQNPDKNFS
jgi:hypothetical protein